jgi:hypothetical protein
MAHGRPLRVDAGAVDHAAPAHCPTRGIAAEAVISAPATWLAMSAAAVIAMRTAGHAWCVSECHRCR